MEIRVESAEGSHLPPGCYVGVRVGDVLKQGRYEPQRCYNFPAVDRRRNAKIDIYRHVGSTVVAVDPDAKSLHEVAVSSSDPTCPSMKLKVGVQTNSVDAGKAREARTKQVKNQAKDYLSKYSIEEKLSEAVKALLREQPANPTEYICRHLMAGDGGVLPPVSPVSLGAAPTQAPAPSRIGAPAGKPSGQAVTMPFSAYYKANCLPSIGASGLNNIYMKFPAAASAGLSAEDRDATRLKARNVLAQAAQDGQLQDALKDVANTPQDLESIRFKARNVLVQACGDGALTEALQGVSQQLKAGQRSKSGFELRASVGTWLQAKPSGPKKVQVWNKLPSVGTWLARPSEVEVEKETRALIMPAHLLMGPQFYSLGLSPLPRAI